MPPTAEDPKTTLNTSRSSRPFRSLSRAVIEIAFIIFLFYSNLLMGEYDRAAGVGKTFIYALRDIFTLTNFTIAILAALIGYILFETLRKRL